MHLVVTATVSSEVSSSLWVALLDQTSEDPTPAFSQSCSPSKTILWLKNFQEYRLILSLSSCHQSKWITPLSLFGFSRQKLAIIFYDAILGDHILNRSKKQAITFFSFTRVWSFTMHRYSFPNPLSLILM